MYVIVNDEGGILNIYDVPLFGNKVTLLAFFRTEEDALNTLSEIEHSGLAGHHIENLGEDLTVESSTTTFG